MTERIAAVVLAGGRSSRFGRDKLSEPVAGRPMLEHAVDAVRAVATDVIVVISPDAMPPSLAGVEIARDAHAFQGPLAGLAAGLAALDPALERVVVVGGDMPTLVPEVLTRLLDALDRHEGAVLSDRDGPRPLPMAVRRSVAGPASERLVADGERRLRALLGELDVAVIPAATWRADDQAGATFRDVDVPDDLPT